MAIFCFTSLASVALFLAQSSSVSGTFLAPAQDIVLPSTDAATNPLTLLGANSPYFTGPNINDISNEVPEGCEVEQVAYVVRHGSRYPDSGAYAQWTTLYAKIQNATFTASGSMDFLQDWHPVLTNPALQIAQESPTGYKEAYDLGYTLRTRYPDLYQYGQSFISWANLYPRVVQTAQNFVRGFLGQTASSLGTVITINSTGSEQALFDSLSPSDLCPEFVDGNGGIPQTTWNSIYLPPILARIQGMIVGDLNFTTTDVSIMPYLCGFESQITGKLSPWCGVFTDVELAQYEYSQDLRYYYGMGPGTDLPSKMMLPFANSLVGLLAQGPGVNGTFANGTTYQLPNIITAFLNDGQVTELGAAIGVWDNTISLGNGTSIPAGYTYKASHFVTMRGTVAFERLNCKVATPAKRDLEHDARGLVTETKKKTVTVTICPTETPIFTASSKAAIIVPTESAKTAAVVTSEATTEYTMSTILSTHTYTITSCAPTATNCPIGKATETVYTSTTYCPVAAAEGQATSTPSAAASKTITVAAEYTTSTILSTHTYTITSCAPTVKHCPVGKVTETVYTSTTVCPVSAGETASAASGAGSGSGSGSGSSRAGSGSGASGSTSTNASGSAVSGSSPTSSGASVTASATSTGSGYGSNSTITTKSTSLSGYTNSTSTSTSSSTLPSSTGASTNQTYIRILLNDAVYPVPSCKSGPGSSCLMSEYVAFMAARLKAAGDLPTRCNVTAAGAPSTVKGASFFTDLSDSWLASVAP